VVSKVEIGANFDRWPIVPLTLTFVIDTLHGIHVRIRDQHAPLALHHVHVAVDLFDVVVRVAGAPTFVHPPLKVWLQHFRQGCALLDFDWEFHLVVGQGEATVHSAGLGGATIDIVPIALEPVEKSDSPYESRATMWTDCAEES